MDSHHDASTEEFEAKTKEFESVSHKIFQNANESSPNMPNMSGMGGMPNLNPEQMKNMEEMFANMSFEEKENLMKMAGQQMPDMSKMPDNKNTDEPVIEEID